MTQLSQTQRRTPAVGLAGLALAAAMLGGIVGGVIGIRAQSIAQEATAAQAGADVHAIVTNQVKDDLYVSPQDQGVLKAAQEWEARERQMYPTNVDGLSLSARDQGVLKAAQEWEARERQMYPTSTSVDDLSISARHRGVLSAAQEREARQRQIYPSR